MTRAYDHRHRLAAIRKRVDAFVDEEQKRIEQGALNKNAETNVLIEALMNAAVSVKYAQGIRDGRNALEPTSARCEACAHFKTQHRPMRVGGGCIIEGCSCEFGVT